MASKPAVTTLATGERVIAGTRRKDGTVRKEVKIRAGYVTEELDDRARAYKKQVQRAADLKNYIPGMGTLEEQKARREAAKAAEAGGSSRAARRRRAKERTTSDAWSDDEAGGEGKATAAVKPAGAGTGAGAAGAGPVQTAPVKASDAPKAAAPAAAPVEKDEKKEARKLQKLLRQIEQLEISKANGKALTEEEQTKLNRKETVQRELAALGNVQA